MPTLDITPVTSGAVHILELAGHLDHASCAALDERLASIPGNRIVIDVSKLDYIGSGGLRSILAAVNRVSDQRGGIAIAAPSESVAKVFQISGFVTLVQVFPTRAEAVAALA